MDRDFKMVLLLCLVTLLEHAMCVQTIHSTFNVARETLLSSRRARRRIKFKISGRIIRETIRGTPGNWIQLSQDPAFDNTGRHTISDQASRECPRLKSRGPRPQSRI